MKPSFHNWAEDRLLKGLVLLVLALMAVALLSYTYYSYKSGKYMYNGPTTISVRGEGEVTRAPDIATFSFNVRAEADTPEAAQQESAEAVNTVFSYLKESGVAEADIKTSNYNLYPRYDDRPEPMMDVPCDESGMNFCPPGVEKLVGYAVDQTVQVKVRDTGKAGEFITGVGSRGATNISGLMFALDDDSDAKAEARAKAIEDGKAKAKQLADALDVRITRLQGFWEEEGGYPMYEKGYGGAMMDDSVVPELPPGENIITSTVNLTYEIR